MFLKFENPKGLRNFDGLEPRRCKDIKGIVASEIGPKRVETCDKQLPKPRFQRVILYRISHTSDFPKQWESNEFPRETCESSYTRENDFKEAKRGGEILNSDVSMHKASFCF